MTQDAKAGGKLAPWKEMQPVFINTENVRRFLVAMSALDLSRGKPRLMGVWGEAGVGKSYCVTTYIARQPEESLPYLKCRWVWAHSGLEFLRALCRAVGVEQIPYRKAHCFERALEAMEAHPHRPLFVDDFHRLDRLPGHLEIMRDLTEMSGAPVILIGEEKLKFMLQNHRQIWSRTKQAVEFGPNQAADVVRLAREGAGLELDKDAAVRLHAWAGGDRWTAPWPAASRRPRPKATRGSPWRTWTRF
jgi:DNA transposition AAA+ family ATPase